MAFLLAVLAGLMMLWAPWGSENRAERSGERWAEELGVRIGNSPLLDHAQDMTQANVVLAAAESGASVMRVDRVDGRDGFYEWNAIVVRFDVDTSLFVSQSTEACWRLLFEGGFYKSKSVVDCGDGDPLELLSPEDEAVPDDAGVRLERILEAGGSIDGLRARILAEFVELNSRNVKILVADDVVGVALDDGRRCVLARRAGDVRVVDVSVDPEWDGSCRPSSAVQVLGGASGS